MHMGAMTDRVLRAMTDDGAFRIITARTTDTVTRAIAAQEVDGAAARVLGEMVTAAVLFRETMAPTLRVQGVIKGLDQSGQVIADSHPDGWNRGLVQRSDEAPPFRLGEGALMQMMRSLPNGELHQGLVELPAGGTVSHGLMGYMQQSEQTVTMARVAAVLGEGGAVKAAGGYLVQLLPEAPEAEGALAIMAQRLEDDFSDIEARLVDTDASPDHLVEEIFWGMKHTRLDDSAIRFGCDCSRVRVLTSLSTLTRDEIRELIDGGEALEMSCDWCGTRYRVELAELEGLAQPS